MGGYYSFVLLPFNVPEVGIEPTRPCDHLILSQGCLPVSALGQLSDNLVAIIEAQAGVEPAHNSFADCRVNHFATEPHTLSMLF